MKFRKINYLTLVYHFFAFNYTLGAYKKMNNDFYYRKAKMHVFFSSFTSLNNMEGRPFHVKKRPFSLYYFLMFCKHKRESLMPYFFKTKNKIIMPLFRYFNNGHCIIQKRVYKKNDLLAFFSKCSHFFENKKYYEKFLNKKIVVFYLFFGKIINFFYNDKTIFKIKYSLTILRKYIAECSSILFLYNFKLYFLKNKRILNFRKKMTTLKLKNFYLKKNKNLKNLNFKISFLNFSYINKFVNASKKH